MTPPLGTKFGKEGGVELRITYIAISTKNLSGALRSKTLNITTFFTKTAVLDTLDGRPQKQI